MFRTSILAGAIMLTASCTQQAEKTTVTENPEMSNEELIARGKYVTTIAGCNDCHSPKIMTAFGPVPDTTRLMSGHPENEALPPTANAKGWVLFSMGLTASVGPWGTSYAANLTPDDTGIGNWTLEQFKTAIQKGKYKGLEGSRPLLPPMPWQQIKNLADQDLEAIFTYLQSI